MIMLLLLTCFMISSPVTTAIFKSTLAAAQTDFKAAAQASGFTPPALLSTLIPEIFNVTFLGLTTHYILGKNMMSECLHACGKCSK